ncbi:MAG: Hsp70 family protein [Melioribacteraceae bacterium]
MSDTKIIKIPFDVDGENYSFDYSIVSYENGDPSKPRVGKKALEFEEYLVKNMKQIMKFNSNDRNRTSLWKQSNFIYNENLDLTKFEPDLPQHSFTSLIKIIIINQIQSYLRLYNKVEEFDKIDLLFGIPVFNSSEGMPDKRKNKYKDDYKNNIKSILKKIGINNKVVFLYEPFAIIRHTIYNKLLDFKEKLNRILVIDFGGSTFNCCVVSTTNTGEIAEGNKYKNVFGTNYLPWGCSEVDKYLLETLVQNKLGLNNWKFNNKDYHLSEIFKIKISKEIKNNINGPWELKLDSIKDKISISKEDFKNLINTHIWNKLKETITKTIDDSQDELDRSYASLDFILFAGGGSNLPFLKDFFTDDFKDKIKSKDSIIIIDNPELAVASGLAIDAKYKLEKTEDSLSDDENIENELFLQLSCKGDKISKSTKIRILPNAGWNDSCQVLNRDIKKEDLVNNTKNKFDKKPWEVKLSKEIELKKIDYLFYDKEGSADKSQFERYHIYLDKKLPKRLRECDLFLDTNESGLVTPSIQFNGLDLAVSKKPFELWSYTPSKEMLAIDLGNSTTSMFLITEDLSFGEIKMNDELEMDSSSEIKEEEIIIDIAPADHEVKSDTERIEEPKQMDIIESKERGVRIANFEILETLKQINLSLKNLVETISNFKFGESKIESERVISDNITLASYYEDYLRGNNFEIVIDNKFEYKFTTREIDFVYTKFNSYLQENGKFYNKNSIYSFITSIFSDSNYLTILAGPPGSGKTSLVKSFNNFLSTGSNLLKDNFEFFKFISVSPNWMAPENLLGTYNHLTQNVIVSEFTTQLAQANYIFDEYKDNSPIVGVLLDEFNLAHPEIYLSPLLSAMESKSTRQISLRDKCGKFTLEIPLNFKIIATINVDAASKSLSPKVLDRASFIRILPSYDNIQEFAKRKINKQNHFDLLFGTNGNENTPIKVSFETLLKGGSTLSFRSVEKICEYVNCISNKSPIELNDHIDSILTQFILTKLPANNSFYNSEYTNALKKMERTFEKFKETNLILKKINSSKLPGHTH